MIKMVGEKPWHNLWHQQCFMPHKTKVGSQYRNHGPKSSRMKMLRLWHEISDPVRTCQRLGFITEPISWQSMLHQTITEDNNIYVQNHTVHIQLNMSSYQVEMKYHIALVFFRPSEFLAAWKPQSLLFLSDIYTNNWLKKITTST